MFRHIIRNGFGRPLVSCQAIAATTTRASLRIQSGIDDNECPLGIRVSEGWMQAMNIRRDGFHGEWNHRLINRQK